MHVLLFLLFKVRTIAKTKHYQPFHVILQIISTYDVRAYSAVSITNLWQLIYCNEVHSGSVVTMLYIKIFPLLHFYSVTSHFSVDKHFN